MYLNQSSSMLIHNNNQIMLMPCYPHLVIHHNVVHPYYQQTDVSNSWSVYMAVLKFVL